MVLLFMGLISRYKSMGRAKSPAGNGFYQVENDTYAWDTDLSVSILPIRSLINYGYFYSNSNSRQMNGITYRIKPSNNTSSTVVGELKRMILSKNPLCAYFFNTIAQSHLPPQWNNKIFIDLNQMKSSEVKQFYAKLELLKEILIDTNLLDCSADYVQFYYTHLGSNLYKLALAGKFFANYDTLSAISTLQTVVSDTLLKNIKICFLLSTLVIT